jgi:tetratricopeptide (TPR) repeat protein
MLSRRIGRAKFRRILQTITKKYAFNNLSFDEFVREIETGAGLDLKWFFKQWFEQTGAPHWQLSWRQDGNILRGTVNQTAPYYKVNVEVKAVGDEQSFTGTVELSGQKTEFAFPVNFRARSVTVDPNFKVLHWTDEYLRLKSALGAYVRSNIEREQGNFEAAESLLKKALEQETKEDIYGARFLLEMGLGQLYLGQNKFQEAKTHLERAVARSSRRETVLPWAYFYLARAAQGLNDKEAARRAVENAISAEAAVGGRIGAANAARALLTGN